MKRKRAMISSFVLLRNQPDLSLPVRDMTFLLLQPGKKSSDLHWKIISYDHPICT